MIYFRKEGRALGEVIKYLVYNARKRGGDTADKYFTRTENIAGVRDVRKKISRRYMLVFCRFNGDVSCIDAIPSPDAGHSSLAWH